MPDDRPPATRVRSVQVHAGGVATPQSRMLIREEPLEVFIDGNLAGTLLRTPGDEQALAAGFCLSAGFIEGGEDLATIAYRKDVESSRIDVVRTSKARGSWVAAKPALLEPSPPGLAVTPELLALLPPLLHERQKLFSATGGAHAAVLTDEVGSPLAFAEDVGRHNALDKAIGALVLDRRRPWARIGFLSSRVSFEMVQKALRARLSLLCAVSAATDLAVDLAERYGLTLVGFLRGAEWTVYVPPPEVVALSGSPAAPEASSATRASRRPWPPRARGR